MGGLENRQIVRDSLFVLADLRLDGDEAEHRIKMRNLSSGGMMAEGPLGAVRVVRGMVVWISLRNIGWVEGTIAWVQESRFGVAFRHEIDPRLARAPKAAGAANRGLLVHRSSGTTTRRREGPLRKV